MATRITYFASVSFEFDLRPVLTVRGEIVAPNAARAASRAVQQARRAFPGSRPRSIVVVLEVRERVVVRAPDLRPSTHAVDPSAASDPGTPGPRDESALS